MKTFFKGALALGVAAGMSLAASGSFAAGRDAELDAISPGSA